MILTVVLNSEKLKNIYEKRDCQAWQPLTLISPEIREYIENTKNQMTKMERFAAYSLLFSLARDVFGKEIKEIGRAEHGKPYALSIKEADALSFSISHSDGIVAVTVSDEGECGVDIQSIRDSETVKRVEDRFLSSVDLSAKGEVLSFQKRECPLYSAVPSCRGFLLEKIDNDSLDISSLDEPELEKASNEKASPDEASLDKFSLDESALDKFSHDESAHDEAAHEKASPDKSLPDESSFSRVLFYSGEGYEVSFLRKWTLTEAVLKCFGKGFSDLKNVNELGDRCNLFYSSLSIGSKVFGISCVKSK